MPGTGPGGAHLGLALELDRCLAAAGTPTLLACLTGAVNPPGRSPCAAPRTPRPSSTSAPTTSPADPRSGPQSNFDPLFEPFFFKKTSRKVPFLLEKNGSKTSQKRARS